MRHGELLHRMVLRALRWRAGDDVAKKREPGGSQSMQGRIPYLAAFFAIRLL